MKSCTATVLITVGKLCCCCISEDAFAAVACRYVSTQSLDNKLEFQNKLCAEQIISSCLQPASTGCIQPATHCKATEFVFLPALRGAKFSFSWRNQKWIIDQRTTVGNRSREIARLTNRVELNLLEF